MHDYVYSFQLNYARTFGNHTRRISERETNRRERMSGIFYGAGVGPGDPELLTVKALRVMKQCPVIAIPVSDKNFTEAAYDRNRSCI